MNRTDRIKLDFIRNWKLPGQERLSNFIKGSKSIKSTLKDGIVWLTNEDIAIYTSADSYIEWAVLSNGTYEEEINKLIRISLKQGGIALDIGANIGLQSIRMSQAAGETGMVYAFEPLNYLREKFKKNIALNSAVNITMFPYALSNQASEADFKIDRMSWNQGTFSLTDKIEGVESEHVIIKVADEMAEIQNLAALQLVKIDVEGFEFQVLQGLKQTIQKHKPRIIFEYDKNYWQQTGQQIGACYSYLNTMGYLLYQVTSVGCELITNAEQIEGGNLFCIPF